MTPDRKIGLPKKSDVEKKESANVLYLSELTPSPQTIFACWSLKKLGKLDDLDETSVVPSTSVAADSEIPGHHIVLPKFDGESRGYINEITQEVTDEVGEGTEAYTIRRISNYLTHCFVDQKYPPRETLEEHLGASTLFYDALLEATVISGNNHPLAIKKGMEIIDEMVTEGLDPFKHEDKVRSQEIARTIRWQTSHDLDNLETELQQAKTSANSGATVEINIPLLRPSSGDRAEQGESGIIETITLERFTGAIELLRDENLGFAIVGPANSGKSTVAANLAHATNSFLTEIGSDIECKGVDFDARTPDLRKIIDGKFEGFEEDEKTDWTDQIAAERVINYYKERVNVNIISTPGGDPDDITEILILPVDSVMLLIAAETDEEWAKKRNTWRNKLRDCGHRQIDVLVRSRLKGEKSRVTGETVEKSGITSIAWKEPKDDEEKYRWARRVGARAVNLDRQIVDEPLFRDLARLLVLDLLPRRVMGDLEHKIDHLKFLQEQYSG